MGARINHKKHEKPLEDVGVVLYHYCSGYTTLAFVKTQNSAMKIMALPVCKVYLDFLKMETRSFNEKLVISQKRCPSQERTQIKSN